MTALRQDLAAVLDKSGGVMTIDELSAAVLAARGSVADEPHGSNWQPLSPVRQWTPR